jgi:hypothetical protein
VYDNQCIAIDQRLKSTSTPLVGAILSDAVGVRGLSVCELKGLAFVKNPQRIARLVMNASADLVTSIICDNCGGALDVQFTPIGKAALSVRCANCGSRVVTDGITKVPPWVRVLGRKISTKTKGK